MPAMLAQGHRPALVSGDDWKEMTTGGLSKLIEGAWVQEKGERPAFGGDGGLRATLDLLAEEGPEATFARHRRLARAARAAVAVWAEAGTLDFNVVEPVDRAEAVTTVLMAEDQDANAVRKVCYDRFDVSLGTGLGKLDGRAFRIAHMGDVNEPMLLGALGCVEATLGLLGVPHGAGGVTAAVETLARQD